MTGLSIEEIEKLDKKDGKKDSKYNGRSLFDVVNENYEEYKNSPINKQIFNSFFKYLNFVFFDVKATFGLSDDKNVENANTTNNENDDRNIENENIANELVKQIFKLGFADLDEPISKINADNVLEVMELYQEKGDKKNLGLDKETLIEAILDESISNEKKKEYIEHIKNALVARAEKLTGDTSYLQKLFAKALDITLEKTWPFQNPEKLENLVNKFVEIINQLEEMQAKGKKVPNGFELSSFFKDYITKKYSELADDLFGNGSFDNKATQTNGSCWIHAGINNMLESPKGKEYINNLITKDPDTGNITVFLPGAKRDGLPKPNGDGKYVITERDILDNICDSSMGDGDYTAFILAIQRYRKELDPNDTHDGGNFYKFTSIIFEKPIVSAVNNLEDIEKFNNDYQYDINQADLKLCEILGDEPEEEVLLELELLSIYKIEDKRERYNKIREKFNNENFIINASTGELAQAIDENNSDILSNHAYTVLKMNDNNVWLEESNNPGSAIVVSVDDFMDIFKVSICAI